MPPITPFGVGLIIIVLMPLIVALSVRFLYPRVAPYQSYELLSPLFQEHIFALAEESFPKRGVFGYGRWWARTTPAPNMRSFATYPLPYISFGGAWIMLMGRGERVTVQTSAEQAGTRVQISARGYAAQDQARVLQEQITALQSLPLAATQTAPAGQAMIVSAENGWRCSACAGYVRSDATTCKHCKQPLLSQATLLNTQLALARQQGSPIIADGAGWRCGACQGYVRRDATSCKHCGQTLAMPLS